LVRRGIFTTESTEDTERADEAAMLALEGAPCLQRAFAMERVPDPDPNPFLPFRLRALCALCGEKLLGGAGRV
jgi:hypothetical protein